jgi:hypothetical protein
LKVRGPLWRWLLIMTRMSREEFICRIHGPETFEEDSRWRVTHWLGLGSQRIMRRRRRPLFLAPSLGSCPEGRCGLLESPPRGPSAQVYGGCTPGDWPVPRVASPPNSRSSAAAKPPGDRPPAGPVGCPRGGTLFRTVPISGGAVGFVRLDAGRWLPRDLVGDGAGRNWDTSRSFSLVTAWVGGTSSLESRSKCLIPAQWVHQPSS